MTASGPVFRDDHWNRIIVRAEHRFLGLDDKPKSRAGTAFFITPTRLLTAAHLINPGDLTADTADPREWEQAAKACKVQLYLDTGEVEAAVVDIDLTLDAVLLEIPTGAAVMPPRLLDQDHATIRMQRWWARGYPSKRGEGRTLTMSGTVSNAANTLSLNGVSVTIIELSRSQGTHDPHGYSGGPVILTMPDGQEWIIGLVRRNHDDPNVIWASPIHLVAQRFAAHGSMRCEPLASPPSAATFPRLSLWRQGSGRLRHEPRAPDFGPWWNPRSDQRGQLVLDFSPSDEPALVSAIGRLALHGGLARIDGRAAAAWRQRIETMTKAGLPVPGSEAATHVAAITFGDTAPPPATAGASEVVTAELARQIHKDLDQETLKQLNEVVDRVLGGDRTLTKWRIEDDLAVAMREIWGNWFRALEMDQPMLRDFLKLMLQAGRPDRRLPDHPLAWLGPATITPCLLPATLMALAFAATKGNGVSQPAGADGRMANFTSAAACGHACGAEFTGTNNDNISDTYRDRGWEADYVLLPRAEMPVEVTQALNTRIGHTRTPTDLRDIPAADRVYLDGGQLFRRALGQGSDAVQRLISAAVEILAERQRQMIDNDLSPEEAVR